MSSTIVGVIHSKCRLGRFRWLALLIHLILICGGSTMVSAQDQSQLRQKLQSTTDPRAQAKLYKELGDQLVRQDKIEDAAESFSKALALDADGFSSAERVEMAIYLSWTNRLAEARAELARVLALEPQNIAARAHLARVLAWSGQLAAAITEADRVLAQQPQHKDALLVKADALQWQGRNAEAIPIYKQIVERDGDFDARAGLARAQLAVGNRLAALENRDGLKPQTAKQQSEFGKLNSAIDDETRPIFDSRYNYYHDSDKNRVDRYNVAATYWVGNQKLGLDYRHTDATDPTRHNRAEDFLAKLYSRVTDSIGAGAAIGFSQLADRHTSTFPTGQLRIDAKVFDGGIGATMTREVLSDTPELVDNRIRMTTAGLNLQQNLTERFSVLGRYNYKSFSDGNHANELQLATQYAVYLAPRIVIGHRFRLLDFQKQTGSGYFDPNNYLANRAFTSLYYENRIYYTYIEGFLGYETFRRNGVASDNFIHGGSGSVGIKPLPYLSLEVNVEGGNFAAGSVSGFNYFNVGPRILFRF
jgi:tetratricopeptide (TPR) repeat protein